MTTILQNPPALAQRILQVLHEKSLRENFFSSGISASPGTSAVLFLVGLSASGSESPPEPCLILNKRSVKVKQPGDLCCPGGSLSRRLDRCIAGLLNLPGSPLKRWPFWVHWRKNRPREARRLALLFAAGLRESFEEMRMNPLRVGLLGPLPPQRLIMFDRVIYPLACRVSGPQRFFPNWEVEKVVFIPLRELLDPSNYARYRLQMNISEKSGNNREWPCFRHFTGGGSEILWGATYRVTMVFLEMIFGFKPPEPHSLPVVRGTLEPDYLTGNS